MVTSPLWARELSLGASIRDIEDTQIASSKLFYPRRVSRLCLPIIAMPSLSYSLPLGIPLSLPHYTARKIRTLVTNSAGQKLIKPERNSLADNIIEALKCLRAWWNSGLVKRL